MVRAEVRGKIIKEQAGSPQTGVCEECGEPFRYYPSARRFRDEICQECLLSREPTRCPECGSVAPSGDCLECGWDEYGSNEGEDETKREPQKKLEDYSDRS